MIVHATPLDLANWTGETAPDNAGSLLRSASLMVDRATVTAVYAVDSGGNATDRAILEALRDATCAQVATWTALGIDPTAGPAGATAGQVVRKSLATATIEYDKGTSGSQSAAAAARQAAVTELCAESVQLLAAAGLLTGPVQVYG